MRMSRRTFLVSSAAALAYVAHRPGLAKTPKRGGVDLGSTEGVLPFGPYSVTATIEFASVPVEDDLIEFYWGPPGSNPINCQFIGHMMSLPEQISYGFVGTFSPGCEQGQLNIINRTSQPMKVSVDMVKLNDTVDEEDTVSLTFGEPISFKKDEITWPRD